MKTSHPYSLSPWPPRPWAGLDRRIRRGADFKGAVPVDQWLTIPRLRKVAAAGLPPSPRSNARDNGYDVEATGPNGERRPPCPSGHGRGDQLAHRRLRTVPALLPTENGGALQMPSDHPLIIDEP